MIATVLYQKKEEAIKSLPENYILANYNISKGYFHVKDHKEFLKLIKSKKNKFFYEYISENAKISPFVDIDLKKDEHPQTYESCDDLIQLIKKSLVSYFKEYKCRFLILESHLSDVKKSYHVIVRITNDKNQSVYITNVECLKNIILSLPELKQYISKKIIDPSVYREGIFRTIHSTKQEKPTRPLIKSELSDDFEDIETFVTWYSSEPSIIFPVTFPENPMVECLLTSDDEEIFEAVPEALPSVLVDFEVISDSVKKTIGDFVKSQYNHLSSRIREINIDKSKNYIIVSLNEKYCNFIKAAHKNNNQYIILNFYGAKQKCHDTDCGKKNHKPVKFKDLPNGVKEVIKKYLGASKTKEKNKIKDIDIVEQQKVIDMGKKEIAKSLNEYYSITTSSMDFNKESKTFTGLCDEQFLLTQNRKCEKCVDTVIVTEDGVMTACNNCKARHPVSKLLPSTNECEKFWVNYTQINNYTTVNNTTIINPESSDGGKQSRLKYKIDYKIFNDAALTTIINNCLDGHKRNQIAKLMSVVDKAIARDEKWFIFHENVWIVDKDQDTFFKRIMELFEYFNKVRDFYIENNLPESNDIISNIDSLEQSFNRSSFKNEIISEAGMYYNKLYKFKKNLNTKKNLVPFTNGVYNTTIGEFRNTKIDDYISVTVGYEHDPLACNKDVYTFLEQVLPNKAVRDYTLKRFSDCLNGDRPNTLFVIFIGESGGNGKSQILNLAKATLGDLAAKMEVTLLTRPRNNANEASTEKAKLLYKRMGFFSEPEENEKINIGLLKELTGSEEVVARAIYSEPISFVIETKFFLACNELPEIKGEDTALWRRIRVIDFPSKFVSNPVAENEYPINENLAQMIRDDLTWRQTFMNILIEYYNKEVPEPEEVRVRTNEYRTDNNELEKWAKDNLIEDPESNLLQTSINNAYFYKFLDRKNAIPTKELGKFNTALQNTIKNLFKKTKPEYKNTTLNGKSFRGWTGLKLKEEILCSSDDEDN